MFVRIPAINAECFIEESIYSLTKRFIESQEWNLTVLGRIVTELSENEDGDDAFEQIESDADSMACDFEVMIPEGKTNPFDFVLNLLRSGESTESTLSQFREEYPILTLVDEQGEVSIDTVEKYTELDYSELYPLYCKPSDEVLSHFLQHTPAVAFFEVEGNFFMGLTTSGSYQGDKIALGYLMVDDYIPHNYIDRKKNRYDGLSDEQALMINAFFDNEVSDASAS